MAAGFPTRPARGSFGPDPVNTRPVRDRSRELDGEDIGRLLFHQIAGLGLMIPLARVRMTAQASPILIERFEAWNPQLLTTGDFVDPTLIRVGAGIYTIEYPSPIADHEGTATNLSFRSALGFCDTEDDDDIRVRARRDTASRVRFTVRDGAGTLVDGENVHVLIF